LKHFTFHPSIHGINTKKKLQKHRPLANPVSYQKGVHYAGVKTFNELPISTGRSVREMEHFIAALKRYLTDRSFHSFDEYLHTDVTLRYLVLSILTIYGEYEITWRLIN
jgi:hypothetical protein